MIFAALVGGIVGSRLDFIIENYDTVSDDLLGNLFSGSGLVWYGGAIGGAIAVVHLGSLARDAQPDPARHLRPRARDRLRDRAHRVSALRRRRLRHPLGRAVGDGLPGWDRAHGRTGPPTPIYETLAMGLAPTYSGACATDSVPACCSPSIWYSSAPSVSGRVHPPQRRRRIRPHPGTAAECRDDPRRRAVVCKQGPQIRCHLYYFQNPDPRSKPHQVCGKLRFVGLTDRLRVARISPFGGRLRSKGGGELMLKRLLIGLVLPPSSPACSRCRAPRVRPTPAMWSRSTRPGRATSVLTGSPPATGRRPESPRRPRTSACPRSTRISTRPR